MKPLVVIPTYNEKENLKELLPEVFRQDNRLHVLIVDDGSPDGTADLVRGLQKTCDDRLHLLERTKKEGLGRAYIAGFHWGMEHGFDFLVEMDADWSHPPRFLSEMLKCGDHHDFVIGSRYVAGGGTVNWSCLRKMISRGGSFYARTILGVPIKDFTGGFNGWNKKVLQSIGLDGLHSDGYSFQIELKYKAVRQGFRFKEFPITFEERRQGESKMSSAIVREALWRVWKIRRGI